jgi:hypothetical protein
MLRRSWNRNWIVLTAITVHAVWGLVLLFSDAPLHTTPMGMIHAIPYLNNQYVSAFLYLGASGVATIPLVKKQLDTTFVGLLTALPQQFLLMVSFFTALASVIRGAYPDGYVPDKYGDPHLFIFVDQLWPMLGMVMHTLSLIDWYWWSQERPKGRA